MIMYHFHKCYPIHSVYLKSSLEKPSPWLLYSSKVADVKFGIAEIENSCFLDAGEIWCLQGGSATGVAHFLHECLECFRRYMLVCASCKAFCYLPVHVLSAIEFVLTDTRWELRFLFF